SVEPACSSPASASSSSSPRSSARAPKPGKRGAGRRAAKLPVSPPQQRPLSQTSAEVEKKLQKMAMLPLEELSEHLVMEKNWLENVIRHEPPGFPLFFRMTNAIPKKYLNMAEEQRREQLIELFSRALLQFGLQTPIGSTEPVTCLERLTHTLDGVELFVRLLRQDSFRSGVSVPAWLGSTKGVVPPLLMVARFFKLKQRGGAEVSEPRQPMLQPILAGNMSAAISMFALRVIQYDDLPALNSLLELGLNKNLILANGLSLCHMAAQRNALKTLSRLLKLGVDSKATDAQGNTPAHLAAANGSWDTFFALWTSDRTILQVRNSVGDLPVTGAIDKGHWAFIEKMASQQMPLLLSEQKLAVLQEALLMQDNIYAIKILHMFNVSLFPALRMAVLNENLYALQDMHHKHIDLGVADEQGNTIAHIAAERNKTGVIQILHWLKIDLNKANVDGNTPLARAIINNHLDVIDFLHTVGVSICEALPNGLSPVHVAALNDRDDVIRKLHQLDRRPEVLSRQNNMKIYATTLAASRGYVAALRALHECGVDLMQVDSRGFTAELVAAQVGHVAPLRLMVELGYVLNQKNMLGYYALHSATLHSHPDVIRYLHSQGGDLNLISDSDTSPVHIAAERCDSAVFQLIMELGANLSQTNRTGLTPAHIAAFHGRVEILSLLLAHDPGLLSRHCVRAENLYHVAAFAGQAAVVRFLHDNKAPCSIRQKNTDGHTPAHLAVIVRKVDVLEVLGELEPASLCEADAEGLAPIHLAARNGYIDEFLKLLSIELVRRTNGLDRCAIYAVKANQFDIVKILLEKNLIHLKTMGRGLLHEARKHGFVKIVCLLNDYGVTLQLGPLFFEGQNREAACSASSSSPSPRAPF
ncbi:ankyrin repeat domain-containing protein, partial [Legionella sp. CNM-4043-24]|uniref:ankyrin repeat domain-containing protein n=1 Tax=Legionella sp. CNM-4043-24 TaxID=3421646 RepID=UPI00403A8F1E